MNNAMTWSTFFARCLLRRKFEKERMPYAISIRSEHESSVAIRSLWSVFAQLESAPSMESMVYPPHITLAIYDDIPSPALFDSLQAALEKMNKCTIHFNALSYFEQPGKIIVWAAPCLPNEIANAHTRIHNQIDRALCREHYRPGIWVPHCSLATDININRKEEALLLIEQYNDSFDVVFDTIDCVAFLPVKVLKEHKLPNKASV